MIFFKRLFNFGHTETKGDILFFRLFEAIIIFQAIFFAWYWAFCILHLRDVIFPLGIANYIDFSFMLNAPFALLNAVLITGFGVSAYFHKGRYYYLLTLLCMHLQYVARFSQGKVGHGSNYVGMALIALAAAAIFIKGRSDMRKIAMGLFFYWAWIYNGCFFKTDCFRSPVGGQKSFLLMDC